MPRDRTPNTWSARLEASRASGRPLLDLTEANPTRVGLAGLEPGMLPALADPGAAHYRPDPRGLAVSRAAIAGYYGERGLAIDANAVVLTSGTSEGYAHLFRLLGDPGDVFLAPAPGYPLLEPLAAIEGVRLVPYRLAYDDRWRLDADALAAAWDPGVRGVIVVQPNHPTGSCLSAEALAPVEALCARHGAALIADEVFGDFGWDGRPLPSLLGPRSVPTFVLSGLSKVCGMPQLKLGWIAVAGPEAQRAEALAGLEWIADLFLSVATPVQLALPELLAGRRAWQARVHTRIAANLSRVRAAIARGAAFDLRAADGGWVAMLAMPSRRSDERWALALLDEGVAIHPGQFYDCDDDRCLVASLIVDPADFDAAITRIERLAAGG